MNSPATPPPAPDPVATANAQTASNVKTATTQNELNNVNQVTPYGKLDYSQIGSWDDGTPKFQAEQTLSPEQQKLFNLGTQTQGNLGQIGVDQSAKVGQILNTPFDVNSAISTQLSDQATKLLDPVWKQRENDVRSQLLNQGYAQGSEGYNNNIRDFNDSRDRAYSSAALAGRSQAEQEALTNRNQPLNEISSLLSNSQVSQPNFVNTAQSTVAPTDVAGITQAGYQNSLVPWQAKNQYNQALMGGLFGLGGAAAQGATMGMTKSDRRVKKAIAKIGSMFDGTPIYSFRYIDDPDKIQIGVMAQDIEKMHPSAVREIDGIKHVDYFIVTMAAAAMGMHR